MHRTVTLIIDLPLQMSNFMNQIAFKRGWNKVFARARIRWTLTVLSELEDYLGKLQIKISLGFLLDSMLQSKQDFFSSIQKNFLISWYLNLPILSIFPTKLLKMFFNRNLQSHAVLKVTIFQGRSGPLLE